MTLRFELDDLTSTDSLALVAAHLEEMASITPPEHVHAFDVTSLQGSDVAFWTVWEEQTIVACCALRTFGSEGEIKSVHVLRPYRGQGISKTVMNHLEAEAVSRGIHRLHLETGNSEDFSRARRLYEALGYKSAGPFAGYEPTTFSTFMSKKLT